MIDNHELELQAMALFKEGKGQEAHALQEQFLAEVLGPGKDHCSCPVACKLHGKCVECVTVHRGHGDHLPHCLQSMVNARLEALSALTEHSIKREPRG